MVGVKILHIRNDNLEKQVQIIYEMHFKDKINNYTCISDIIDVRDGTHDSPQPQKYGNPLITSKHLLPFGVDIEKANLISENDFYNINQRSKVNTNDILLSMIGTVGLISYVIDNPVTFAIKNVGLFKTSDQPLFVYYIDSYLRNMQTQQIIYQSLRGSTQKYISLTELRNLPIYMPTIEELKNFNNIVHGLYEKIINNTKENIKLKKILNNLLPKLISDNINLSDI